MKGLVEKELDWLEKEGTIEHIAYSQWAAPVLKSDKKSLRISSHFKLTVNQASRLDQYPIPKVDDLFAELAGGQAFTFPRCTNRSNSTRNQRSMSDQHQ